MSGAGKADPGRYKAFIESFPGYLATLFMDELRKREYRRLDELGQVYLDYTGGGLYAESQIEAHRAMLRSGVFGNPHSSNPSSRAATELVDSARAAVLDYFNADPGEYEAVFTANASGALKIVGESYPFAGGRYLLAFDNHNSVNGIREYARSRGASVAYLPVEPPELRISEAKLIAELDKPDGADGHRLFAYPAQSNFSSAQHPLGWVALAKSKGWDVLLDAAAFVPTNRLDLSAVKPDFVSMSFYKMFGYPTGIGALVARHEAMAKLVKPWFAGGTITVASVQGDAYYLEKGAAAFEDGTINYLGIPAVKIGLEYLRSVGIDAVHERAAALNGWMLSELRAMRHSNGAPLVRIYGPEGLEARGGGMAINFLDLDGRIVYHKRVEELATKRGISIRTGCFCNPGAGELALGISRDELVRCFGSRAAEASLTQDDLRECLVGKANGAVRVSTGIASDFSDAEAMLSFARSLIR